MSDRRASGVTIGGAGLIWGGTERLVLSAEAHYWRLDPADWPRVLDTVVELGFTMVSTYVPWSEHEPAPGRFVFDGALDVERFLALAHERGLGALVRVGPDTASEQTTSGWPRWIVDDERTQARRPNGLPYLLVTATGHCFPPSYASSTFLGATRRWYEAVVPRLAALQHPDGPVVACQVDNELGFHFQGNAFALDHHPEAIARWRQWVADRRGIAIDSVPPKPPGDAAEGTDVDRLDWIAWREHHRVETLATFAAWARALGIEVPILHNDYPRMDTPIDPGRLEADGAVDWAAADVYATAPGGRYVRDVARWLAGSSRLPFLAELGAGWLTLPWLLPLATSAADEEVIALRALFSGAKAVNAYMLVERDRWYGSPVDEHGRARPERAALWPRLRALLDTVDWLSLRRQVRVLVVENRSERRRAAARDTLAGVVPCFSQLLPLDLRATRVPADDDDAAVERWEHELHRALDAAGIDADRATSTALPDLGRYDAVVVTGGRAFTPRAWAQLQAAAAAGVTVVVGPVVPQVDDELVPLTFGAAGMRVMASAADAVAALPAPVIARDRAEIDVHVWHGGGRTVVAAFNASGEPVDATLRFPIPGALDDLWTATGAAKTDDDGAVAVTFDPWGARIWEVLS